MAIKRKKQKVESVQEVVASGMKSQSLVLVGTYKKKPDQLAWIRKHHLYNYPLSEVEARLGNEGWGKVKELWLYSGSKDRRHIYEAEFFGIMLRKDFLAAHPDYPTGGSRSHATAHGDFYAVFCIKHKYQPTIDDSKVIVRTKDFAKRTPPIVQAIKAYQAGGELGSLRVKRSYQVLNKTDVAILVVDAGLGMQLEDEALLERIRLKEIPYLVVYIKWILRFYI